MVPAVAILAAAAAVAPLQDAVELRLGEALQVEQRADETRTFYITLEAGEAYLLEAEQRELDLIIEIIGPDGESRTFDAPLLRFEPERLLIERDSSGIYLISLRSNEYKGGTARYSLKVRELREDGVIETREREALNAETGAAEANHSGGAENQVEALKAYRTAATTWESLGNQSAEARAHLAAAWLLYWHLSDWDGAIQESAESAKLYAWLDDRDHHASALHVRGAAHIETADFSQALVHLETARQTRAEHGENYEQARIVNDIGLAHFAMGEWNAASDHFNAAAHTFRAAEEWAEELKATANLATVDYSQGNLARALDAYARVQDLIRPGELSAWRGELLDNMGTVHRALGNIDQALESYARALALHEEHGSLNGRGRSLSGIGVTYFSIGDMELARLYLERALPIRRETRDGPGLVSTLLFLGNVYLQQGEITRAIEAHREAAELSASPRERARAHVMLGRDMAEADRLDEALQILANARSDGEAAGVPVVVADALLERGRLLIGQGSIEQATLELKEALSHYEDLRWTIGEAQALLQLGRAAQAVGDLVRSADYAAASIRRIEQLRSLIVHPELRASFLATQRDPYSLYISVAMELALQVEGVQKKKWLERALATSERARTRAMLDLIQEAAEGMSVTADADLAENRNSLYQVLAGLRFRQAQLLEREQDLDAMAETRAALDRTETELKILESELRRADPRHANLVAPVTLDAAAIQAALDDDSMLLQYELGESGSWLFVVSADTIAAHTLPPRTDLEVMARRAHELLKSADPQRAVGGELDRLLEHLSRLLISPARPLKPRVVLAADGALNYLPFAALPLLEEDTELRPLISHHEVVTVPSISAVVAQRELLPARREPQKTVAVFADPVFESNDPRLSGSTATAGSDSAGVRLLRAAQWSDVTLRRLPATASEASAIESLVPADQRFVATGLAASRQAVLNAGLGAYRILHFATHALVDDRYPGLSALALSRFNANRTPLDGLLRLHEIYNLELAADLVTLSACETALGRELRGEGLIGLTRAFMHAGGQSVVTSLWQVPDRATAELMRHFYDKQLRDGLSPTAALRQAQLLVAAERRWRDPYYWAAFAVHGEWRLPIPVLNSVKTASQ